MPEVNDLIGAITDRDPVAFADTFDDLVRGRVSDAIDTKRIEVARAVYGSDDSGEEDLDIDPDEIDVDQDLGEDEDGEA